MRWDELFADLEAQLAAAGDAEFAAEVADRTRREAALLSLVDRARASCGAVVQVRAAGAGVVEGRLAEVGAQWLLVDEPAGREVLVPLTAVLTISGLTAWAAAPGRAGRVFDRLGLPAAMRGIARDRTPVTVWLRDGASLSGTVERVGDDFVELSVHAPGELRRRADVHGVRTVPLAAIGAVRRAG